MLQSMLGVSRPVAIDSILDSILDTTSGSPVYGLINPDVYRINHLPTELYLRYGYEFIVTRDTHILPDPNYDKQRIYVAVDAPNLTYVVSTHSRQIIRGTINLSEIDASLIQVRTLEELAAHLPKLMSILDGRHPAVGHSTKSAESFQKAMLGCVFFSLLLGSALSFRVDPIRGSIGLFAQLFLWCSIDLDMPRLLFKSIFGQSSQRTALHTGWAHMNLFGLGVLSSEILCALVLFRIVLTSRERMQNALISSHLIENPRMEIEQGTPQVIDNVGGIENHDFISLHQASSSSPSYSFYIKVALVGLGLCSGVVCLLALAGLSTLSPVGLVVAGVVTASGAFGGLGLFAEKHSIATSLAAMGLAENIRGATL